MFTSITNAFATATSYSFCLAVSNTHLYRLIVTYISLALNINLIVCLFFCFLLLLLYYYLKAASFAQHVASRDVTRFALSHPHVVPYIIIMCVVFHYILPTTRTTLVTLEHNKLQIELIFFSVSCFFGFSFTKSLLLVQVRSMTRLSRLCYVISPPILLSIKNCFLKL